RRPRLGRHDRPAVQRHPHRDRAGAAGHRDGLRGGAARPALGEKQAGPRMIGYVIASAMLMTTPILLAAMGGLVNRVGGIVNIGLESMMLIGALVAVMVSASSGSWLLALMAALIAGAVTGLAMSLTVTRLGANEIIAGLGFNVAVAGVVRFFLKATYGAS